MKKYWHIALMLFCVLMITSCGDDDELQFSEEQLAYISK